ncbi:MAG TPA: DUF4183 domain-containing protein [Paenibacillus sp.]|jgi:hypothetical protein
MDNQKKKVKLYSANIIIACHPERKHKHKHTNRKKSVPFSACRASRLKKGIPKGKKRKVDLCPKKWRMTSNCPPVKFRLLVKESKRPNTNQLIVILPTVKRYFWIADSDINLESEKIIHAHQFINDSGESADQIINFGSSGYINLYINAVLQEGELYTVSPKDLTIKPTGQTIVSGTPIILESVGFVAQYVAN